MLNINPYYINPFLKNNMRVQTAKPASQSSFADKYNLSADTISFSRKRKRKKPFVVVNVYVDPTYRNILEKPLKSTSNPDFKQRLKKVPGIRSLNESAQRISSLSTYLKEKMVGFVVPEYELKEKQKGGYQWFERGLENLLRGSKKPNTQFKDYPRIAKELFGLLSLHDNYWKSQEFIDYLSSLKQSETIKEGQLVAIDATVSAIHELNQKDKNVLSFTGKKLVTGPAKKFTSLKYINELGICAYSGNKIRFDAENHPAPKELITTEHITPQSWVNKENKYQLDQLNDDGNYLMTSEKANKARDNKPLIRFLKGA